MSGTPQDIAHLSPAEKRALLAKQLAERTDLSALFPLSFAQERLWFLGQLDPDSPAYNTPAAYRLTGPLDVAALEQSLNALVMRHEALRGTFPAVGGRPFQMIVEALPLKLTIVDLRSLRESEREAEVRKLSTREVQRCFDLARGPLLRGALFRLEEQEHVFLVILHHMISDAWSMMVFLRELAALYEAILAGNPSPLPELTMQYPDFARWQRSWLQGEVLDGQISYWKRQLADAPTLQLPTDRPRPTVQGSRGATEASVLPEALSEALNELSKRQGVTLFMTLMTAFTILLHRYTGQDDILVGTPIANRNRPEIEGLIGFFVNTLVLRADLSGDPSFRKLLARVREVAIGAYDHQDLPFEKLVEELKPERRLSHNPFFQVMFAFQNVPAGQALKMADLTMRPQAVDKKTAMFDLTLFMAGGPGGLQARLEYSADLFDAATIRRMLGHLQVLLEGIVADPDQRLSELPLLTEIERRQLLRTWNDTRAVYPGDACIHELFEAQVERTPEAVALWFENEQLTYRQLNRRANQLAHHLRTLGVGPEVLVGICIERSFEMVVGILGILKAGGAYVPLDPAYPKPRLALMLEDTRVSVVVTTQHLRKALPERQVHVLCLDAAREIIARESEENPVSPVTADNLVYVIYTSGSTGTPKGVMIAHRALCNHMRWMQSAFPLTQTDRMPQKYSLSFDVATLEILAPLLAGASSIITRPGGHLESAYLVELIAHQRITIIDVFPSLLQVLLAEPGLEACQDLRRVMCGGEAMSPELQGQFFARLDAELHNLYGPTETTIDSTFWTCEPQDGRASVPIGRAIANTQLYILDGYSNPVPVGICGELHIGGVGLARGYLDRPDLTAEKFVPDPFSAERGARLYRTGDLARYLPDGSIEFLGRVDHQVKIRGFRIELGEIEERLKQHPGVHDAAVLGLDERRVPGSAFDASDGHVSAAKRLVAYVVLDPESSPGVSQLREFLQAVLPEYMAPSAFVRLEALPRLPSGKIDRGNLPAPDRERPDREEGVANPQTDMELLLADIWQELLGADFVSVHDNFFDLGGHSLLTMQAIARLKERTGLELNPREFMFQTLGQIAAICERRISEKQDSRVAEERPPSQGPIRRVISALAEVVFRRGRTRARSR